MPRPILYTLFFALSVLGCKGTKESHSTGSIAQATRTASSKHKTNRVARIVFIDQEKCCACTRKRIDVSWKALMTVLGFPPTIPLDHYHLDTQEKEAKPFLSKRAIVAAPGIYFLDQAGNIVELLQGEVIERQLKDVLK